MSRAKLFGHIDFIEEGFLDRSEAAPSVKTLRKWKREAPEPKGFALLAGSAVFTRGTEKEQALSALIEACAALEPEVVLFRPPAAHAPSQSNRELFESLCSSEATTEALGGAVRVLWPRGLWDVDVSRSIAESSELLVCFDPLANDPLEEVPELLARAIEGGQGYLRIDRVGTPRRRLDPFELETLAALVEELESCWLSFAHGERVRDADAFKKLTQG